MSEFCKTTLYKANCYENETIILHGRASYIPPALLFFTNMPYSYSQAVSRHGNLDPLEYATQIKGRNKVLFLKGFY